MNYNETQIRVRYGETDQMGVVYHGNYANYCEVGRLDWLSALGISYKQMELDGVMLPVVSLWVKYKKPARYDDIIIIKTYLEKLPTASIDFNYEIMNQQKELLAVANTKLAFMSMSTNKPIRCPQFILDKLI